MPAISLMCLSKLPTVIFKPFPFSLVMMLTGDLIREVIDSMGLDSLSMENSVSNTFNLVSTSIMAH